jgi:hypothetical protein
MPVILTTQEAERSRGLWFEASLGCGVAQAVGPCRCEALSSNPTTIKRRKEKKNEVKEERKGEFKLEV